jgi:hypothetical protein
MAIGHDAQHHLMQLRPVVLGEAALAKRGAAATLRDRALIATLTYSFARIIGALKMKVEDLSTSTNIPQALLSIANSNPIVYLHFVHRTVNGVPKVF